MDKSESQTIPVDNGGPTYGDQLSGTYRYETGVSTECGVERIAADTIEVLGSSGSSIGSRTGSASQRSSFEPVTNLIGIGSKPIRSNPRTGTDPVRTAYSRRCSVPDEVGTRECRRFRNKIFDKHDPIRHTLVKSYMRIAITSSYVQANLNLLNLNDRLIRSDLRISMDDYELKDFCQNKALLCQRIDSNRNEAATATRIRGVLKRYGIEFPDCEVLAAIQRCKDESWWRRQVRRIQGEVYEQLSRDMHLVHRRDEIYASTPNVYRRRTQKSRNRRLMSELKATNQIGQEFTLQDLIDTSVSNPEVRRAELMVRLRGFETVADNRKLAAEFYTFTCPSRFHSTHQNGRPNKNYDRTSASEANEYLLKVWSRIRAKLHRDGIQVFGFRVAEPHHDGCPHWHMILFMKQEHTKPCRRTCKHYALEESPDEPGALKHRFDYKAIDPQKGSATGYLAKYISKNINGKGLDSDEFGNCPIETAERIDTWASVNRIRQFQQIGGPSVTTWRELRRLHSEESGLIEEARCAADASDWAAFVELMGGPFCGRDQPIKLAMWHRVEKETGEVVDPVLNKYGEPTLGKVYGVICHGITILTRFYTWVIEWVDSPKDRYLSGRACASLEYCQ